MTIIQIQATVGTLIFTIIALITGNISDSYIGVSISDFYLNLKPWKLTQKVLIVVSLGLCLAGVIIQYCFLFIYSDINCNININTIDVLCL